MVLKSASEPIFNVPPVVATTVAVLVLVQAAQDFVLSESADGALLAWFAFIPARYDPTPLVHGAYPGGLAADAWTFLTYALLHGSWLHVGLNLLFGISPLPVLGGEQPVAWQAHLGGFLGGLLAFSAFDPIGPGSAPGRGTRSLSSDESPRQN